MARLKKVRRIESTPNVTYFKPRGVPLTALCDLCLPLEGLEAMRLADLDNLTMEEAASRMGVSRHTFGRILTEARCVVTEALVEGYAIRIEGGHYQVDNAPYIPCNYPYPIHPAASRSRTCPHGSGPAVGGTESKMTKIAVTSEGPGLDDKVDPRFGRAAGFVIVDPETMMTEYVDNGASQARSSGAGIAAAEAVASAGAGVVLTGFVGPKAFSALSAAGLIVGQELDGGTVREAVDKYLAGQVEAAAAPNR
ncbi:DUF134 domain-containing protein [Desulfovibrio inopinatus]|uniref:DUF134 domain-containing protein n=1 Tax=Desulfovibrio inopinatus TaxID=102109 RepID=UPI00041227F6|nr:DUF134 domain-containing protein [Desulfovibrio inopinatus]